MSDWTYSCPTCGVRLEERYVGNNSAHLVCIKCDKTVGVCFEIPDPDPPMPGQTTIEEFLDL